MELNSALLALADPTRRAIVESLARQELSVAEIAAPFDVSQPTISHHLKVLLEGGIVVKRPEGTRRLYKLQPKAIEGIDNWICRLKITIESNYNHLDNLLLNMEEK